MSTEQEPKQPFWNRQVTGRGLGVVIFAGGAVIAYFSIVRPLLAAARHEPSVSLSLKGVVFAPIVLGLGVFFIALGPQATRIMAQESKPTPMGWLFFALVCAVGFGLYLWLKSVLRGYGYAF